MTLNFYNFAQYFAPPSHNLTPGAFFANATPLSLFKAFQ